MKESLKRFLSFCCLFLITLACTKDVGLITEVEFQLLEEHTADGFVNQGLPSTFTIVPEEILENYEYDISYEVLQGSGYFEDVEGNRWETGKGQSISSPFITSLLYMGTEVGEHRVKIVGSDNFGISEEIEIAYNLKNVPARWEASSELSEIELGKAADLSVLFEIVNATLEVTYEARFAFASGSGTLTALQDGGYSLSGDYAAIVPGTYPFVFTPAELGPQQIVFILRDSNGQEIKEELVFNVVEVIRVISIFLGGEDTIEMQLGDEIPPDITFDPPNATDQGVTVVSSDPDVVFIDENNVCIAVGLGTAVVTVTSTSNPEASDTVTVTVVEPDRIAVTSIVISQEDPDAGGAVRQLIATVLPTDATDPSVTWSSNDDTIATISDNGLLTGLTAGSVTITATSVSDPEVNDTITVEITGGSLQNATDITTFELPGQNSSVIDSESHTITVNVTDGTELNVAPSALSISGGATIAPDIAQVRDFSGPMTYTVTAGNGTTQVWTVNVTISPPVNSSETDITAFELPGQNSSTIDRTNQTVTVNVGDGTDLNVAPQVFQVSPGASVEPSPDQIQDFSSPVQYAVIFGGGDQASAQQWTINVTVSPPTGSDQNNITAFELPGQNDGAIDVVNHIITINVPDGTTLSAIAPTVLSVSTGATVDPLISETRNFNGSVAYTVTAENGSPQVWTINVTVAQNQPPVAVDDTAGLKIGETIDIDVLGNDSDLDTPASELIITSIGSISPSGFGSATINGGLIEFISNGPSTEPEVVTFDYTINDGNPGNDATASVTVNISLIEILVTDITLNPTELTLNIGQTGQLDAVVSPGNATNKVVDWISSDTSVATVSTSGEVTAVGLGTTIITASSNDSSDVNTTANVTVNPPASSIKTINGFTINGISGAINGTDIALTLPSSTDIKALSPVIVFTGLSVDPSSGTPMDFTNDVIYTVTAEDGSTVEYTVTVALAANTAPTAQNDFFTIAENGSFNGSVFQDNGNGPDADEDGDNLTVIQIISNSSSGVGDPVSGSEGGILTIAANGDLTFNTDGDFSILNDGDELETAVTYRISDGNGATATATVTVTITGVGQANQAPTAENFSVSVEQDSNNNSIDLGPYINDVDEDILTITINSQPANGISTVSGTNIIYTPTPSYNGEDNIGFTVTDPHGADATNTITITVNPKANTAPVANDDNFTISEGGNLNRPILTNDNDSEGDDLTVDWVAGSSANIGQSIGGSNGGIFTISAGGALIFNTNGDFVDLSNGESQTTTIAYRITDGQISSNTATVRVTVNGIGSSDTTPPTITLIGGNVVLTVGQAYAEQGATALDNIDGDLTSSITINSNVDTSTVGIYQVTYNVSDSAGNAADEIIRTVTVNALQNKTPTAVASSDVGDGSAPLAVKFTGEQSFDDDGSVVSYFWDFDDNGQSSTLANPSHTFNNSGTYNVTLVVTDDANADSPPATARITVDEPTANENPIAVIGYDVASGNVPLTVNFNGSGSNDPDGGTISSYAWDFTDGTTSNAPNPNHTFTSPGFYDVELVVTDNEGGISQLATVRITVIQPNRAPIAMDDNVSVSGTSNTIFEVLGNDSDPDTDPITIQIFTQPGQGGTIELTNGANGPNSAFRFIPSSPPPVAAFLDEFTYRISDGSLISNTAVVYLSVGAAPSTNTPPNAVASANITSGFAPLSVNFTGSASNDPGGGIISHQWEFQDEGGPSVEVNPTHTFNTPGIYYVTLTVTDNGSPALIDTSAPITITVNPPPPSEITWDLSTGTLSGPVGSGVTVRIDITGNSGANFSTADSSDISWIVCGAGAQAEGCFYPSIQSTVLQFPASGLLRFSGNHSGQSGSAVITFSGIGPTITESMQINSIPR